MFTAKTWVPRWRTPTWIYNYTEEAEWGESKQTDKEKTKQTGKGETKQREDRTDWQNTNTLTFLLLFSRNDNDDDNGDDDDGDDDRKREKWLNDKWTSRLR